MKQPHSHERGFALLATGVCGVVIFGMAGLAIDLGRMYITKNEVQTYADAASLSAARLLDGTSAGLTAADSSVTNNPNKWNFGTSAFTGTNTQYSIDGSTGWVGSGVVSAGNVPNIRYVRVTATVNNLPLFFMPVIGTGTTATVKAAAVAGQTLEGTSAANPIKQGVFPYSPIANADGTTAAGVLTSDPTGNFGFTVGQQYDLKWPHNASVGTVGDNKVPCAGDNTAAQINRSAGGGDWGEIIYSNAAALAAAIEDDSSGVNIAINQSVIPGSGQKNAEVTHLQNRVAQDSDTTDDTLSSYLASPAHNGRRLITVLVSNGSAQGSGTPYASNQQNIGVGFAQFLLLTADDYGKNGGSNNPWCAIYAGPATFGAPNGGGGGANGQGVGFIRLLQ